MFRKSAGLDIVIQRIPEPDGGPPPCYNLTLDDFQESPLTYGGWEPGVQWRRACAGIRSTLARPCWLGFAG